MGSARKKDYSQEIKELLKDGRKKFVRLDEGAILYSMGTQTFRKIAEEAKAVYHLGRLVLINTQLVDQYLEYFKDEN